MVPLLFAFYLFVPSMADYDCLCTYETETKIYEHPDVNSTITDFLYEFDCRPYYDLPWVSPTYKAIGNRNQLVFVVAGTHISMQICQGSIPSTDKVPQEYLTAPTTTTTTVRTTTVPDTTTTTPTTTTMKPTTSTEPSTTKTTTPTPRTTTTSTTTTTQKPTTSTKTTSRSTTSTTPTTITTTAKPTTSTVRTIKTTTPKKTTSTIKTTMTTPKPTTKTTIRTTKTTTHAHTIVTAPVNPVQGNNYLCPASVKNHSPVDKLYVHDQFCYEFVPQKNSFFHAEFDCPKRGGTMLYIRDQSDQDFVRSMLGDLHFYGPVWLGLHDINNEESWEWVSDYPLKYKNWMPSRYIENAHDAEDCGIFVPARRGQWDDVHCKGILFSTPAEFPWICQYNITKVG